MAKCEKEMEDPREILKRGVEVPFSYIIRWYHTYRCNNWRKRNGMRTLRECRYKKKRCK